MILILPQITEIFSLGGTRLRDTAVWLPRCAPHSEGWYGVGAGQMWALSFKSRVSNLVWCSGR